MIGQARQSLQEKYPIGRQWSTALNGDVEFNAGNIKAGKSYWWKCNKCGKTWEQAVCARVKSNFQNCHYCKS